MYVMFPIITFAAEFSYTLAIIGIHTIIWGLVFYFVKYAYSEWTQQQLLTGDSETLQSNRIPQITMIQVNIPFTFKLLENPISSYREISCKVSSQVDYRLFVFWGVNIRDLHVLLWKPWDILINEVMSGHMLEGHYHHAGINYRSITHVEKIIRLKMPDEQLELGRPPRQIYPLVVIIMTDNNGLQGEEDVALVSIVHIKDSICTLPTSVLAQYLKQYNGQLSCLKQLYMADSVDNADDLCVICQNYPISRALLPCRHTCICAICFNRLESCPMCRSPIGSFFCIRNEDYVIQRKEPIRAQPTFRWFS
ncbi:hypothetical protein O3M35_003892 [Rhynocoris fuscipes]|uniref:RING-type domain-containing protein n=1 Tax=Rhynocoris fuscipes TaxID=488301 RepID=A0AAW1CHX3_9HEMI